MSQNPYVYRLLEATAIDGDTVQCVVDPGENMRWHRRLRLLGTDAPEAHSRDPLEREAAEWARVCAQKWIDDTAPAFIESAEKPEKFGRWLGNLHAVHPLTGGASLTGWLLLHELVRPYHGDKKTLWHPDDLRRIQRVGEAIVLPHVDAD